MNIPHDLCTRQCVLRILVTLLDHPVGRTKRQLVHATDVSPYTIKGDIRELRNAGFIIEQDEQYRYRLQPNKPYNQLKDILHFGQEDQALLHDAIDQIDPAGKRGQRLKRKLNSLYDYRQLGYTCLKAPYLDKVDTLRTAIEHQEAVILHGYRSGNSDEVGDRRVEPFHLESAEDVLHGFDYKRMDVRHFKLSRFVRITTLEESFQYTARHYVSHTDVFRVVENQTVRVHLHLKVEGFNTMIEQYPLARAYVQPSAEVPGEYDFEAPVNYRFIGLTNFVLGNYRDVVEVVFPELLIDHLRRAAENFLQNLAGGG